ncbi:hypothetical protein GGI35DRAFT_451183 [Trichoderma velutinum]
MAHDQLLLSGQPQPWYHDPSRSFPTERLSPCLVQNGGSPSCGYTRGATVRPDCPGPQRADLLRATA